jgi:hypothetical protein
MEVMQMQTTESDTPAEPTIHGVTIVQEGNGGYSFTVRHTGHFRLQDYEELELAVSSARLVKRR